MAKKIVFTILMFCSNLLLAQVDAPVPPPPPIEKSPKFVPVDQIQGDSQGSQEQDSDEYSPQTIDLYNSMPKNTPKETQTLSGVVVGIRSRPQTEVFLRGAKRSVIIPPGRYHNQLLNKALQSQKSGSEASFKVDAKTGHAVEEQGPATGASAP